MTGRDAVKPQSVLLISQVFPPDPAAVGQYLADVADGIAQKGTSVVVFTASRGYHDPAVKYQRKSQDGLVRVRRFPLSSFGKRNLTVRVLAQISFLVQAIVRGLVTPSIGSVLVSTSPPLGPLAALIVSKLRRVPVTYWVMDINPDQAIATGRVKQGAVAARLLEAVDRRLLRAARFVVTLDRDMANRLRAKANIDSKLRVVPLWPMLDCGPHEGHSEFAATHRADGALVVMYSGNHSLVHPLDTVLGAAERLSNRGDVRFLFVGAGLGKESVECLMRANPDAPVCSLPYQPLCMLRETLSAADVHLVTMGDDMVGLVHPSKIYNAMAVARPLLYTGPPSSISRLIEATGAGWCFYHGDVDGVANQLESLVDNPSQIAAAGRRALWAVNTARPKRSLRGRLVSMALGAGVADDMELIIDLRSEAAIEESVQAGVVRAS